MGMMSVLARCIPVFSRCKCFACWSPIDIFACFYMSTCRLFLFKRKIRL